MPQPSNVASTAQSLTNLAASMVPNASQVLSFLLQMMASSGVGQVSQQPSPRPRSNATIRRLEQEELSRLLNLGTQRAGSGAPAAPRSAPPPIDFGRQRRGPDRPTPKTGPAAGKPDARSRPGGAAPPLPARPQRKREGARKEAPHDLGVRPFYPETRPDRKSSEGLHKAQLAKVKELLGRPKPVVGRPRDRMPPALGDSGLAPIAAYEDALVKAAPGAFKNRWGVLVRARKDIEDDWYKARNELRYIRDTGSAVDMLDKEVAEMAYLDWMCRYFESLGDHQEVFATNPACNDMRGAAARFACKALKLVSAVAVNNRMEYNGLRGVVEYRRAAGVYPPGISKHIIPMNAVSGTPGGIQWRDARGDEYEAIYKRWLSLSERRDDPDSNQKLAWAYDYLKKVCESKGAVLGFTAESGERRWVQVYRAALIANFAAAKYGAEVGMIEAVTSESWSTKPSSGVSRVSPEDRRNVRVTVLADASDLIKGPPKR